MTTEIPQCCALVDYKAAQCPKKAKWAGHEPGQGADMTTFACDDHKADLMHEGYTWPVGEVL